MERFQHYEVLTNDAGAPRELGRGAMGITYHARDTMLHREVALKVINGRYLESDLARERFRREAQAAARLNHENIATVYQFGAEGDGFFYAMEYIRGETVEDYLKRNGPMPPALAIRVAVQVCRALSAAHREGLVHRDIKPANLMLADGHGELRVKVIDFGLAKPVTKTDEAAMSLTVSGFVGTPHFASPEQLEERDLDIRSDIYSLGVTLWYMLDGRPPYSGTFATLVVHHLHTPLPLDKLRNLPADLLAVLEKSMAKDRDERYTTPVDFRSALEGCLAQAERLIADENMETMVGDPDGDFPTVVAASTAAGIVPPTQTPPPVPPPPSSTPAPPPRRSPLPVFLGAVVLLAALAAGLFLVLRPSPASVPPVVTATPTPTPEPRPTPAPLVEATPIPTPTATPDPQARLEAALAAAKEAEHSAPADQMIQSYLDIQKEFPQDPRAAVRLNEIFAEMNDKVENTEPPVPPEPALRAVAETAASAGIVQAMNFLGDRQFFTDPKESVNWYTLAAAKGDEHAITQLGLMYYQGKGVPKDVSKSNELLRQASDLGSAAAQYHLAKRYTYLPKGGAGLPYDPDKAVELFRRSAAQGYPRAFAELGYCYDKGIGMPPDIAEAARLYEQGAAAGDPLGILNLAVFYALGKGVAQDQAKAAELFKQGADLAPPQRDCAFYYADCLERGAGVPQDQAAANQYFIRAAQAGQPDAVKRCKELMLKFTP